MFSVVSIGSRNPSCADRSEVEGGVGVSLFRMKTETAIGADMRPRQLGFSE